MINTCFLQLPPRVKAVSTKNEDGSHTIIVNSILNHEQQLMGYKHELQHIKDDDFDKHNVNTIELSVREKL